MCVFPKRACSMSVHNHPSLQRPTQFDPDEFRARNAAAFQDSGAAAFARYRLAIASYAADESLVVPRSYLSLALVFQSVAVAMAFAPWGLYQTRDLRIATLRGTDMDGVLVVVFGIVAVAALGMVLVVDDRGLAATVGFLLASLCTGIGTLTWISTDTWNVHDPMAVVGTTTPGWGLVAATFASLLASICAFHVMRVARLY